MKGSEVVTTVFSRDAPGEDDCPKAEAFFSSGSGG